MEIRAALARIAERQHLSTDEMAAVMRQVMSGAASDAQIGALLIGMRMKGETIDEITGAVQVMRELATAVPVSGTGLVDIVGTGGDGSSLFNVSTTACFVVAAAGARVAKHGNRSVSSKSGAADLLEAAGVRLDLSPQQVAQCVEQLGVGFMFAPMHHAAMRHAIGPRRELGLRSLFNVLGPLTNPAGVKHMLIGVYDAGLCRSVAEVLGRLGAEHALVVHSDDGLDEISLAAPSLVVEWRDGELREYRIAPEDLGLPRQDLDGLQVADAQGSLALVRAVLAGGGTPVADKGADLVALNAGAALYAADHADSLAEGVRQARTVLASGAALRRLEQLAELTASL